jgi:hypothetical protein
MDRRSPFSSSNDMIPAAILTFSFKLIYNRSNRNVDQHLYEDIAKGMTSGMQRYLR